MQPLTDTINQVNKALKNTPLTIEEIVELNEVANSLIENEHKFSAPDVPMLIEQGRGPDILEHILTNIIKYSHKINLVFATLKARDGMQIIKRYVYENTRTEVDRSSGGVEEG